MILLNHEYNQKLIDSEKRTPHKRKQHSDEAQQTNPLELIGFWFISLTSHVSHGEQLTMAENSGEKVLFAAAQEHKQKHDLVAQESLNIASLQRVVTKMTRDSLKHRPEKEEKSSPEERRA